MAIESSSLEIVSKLLKHGADVNWAIDYAFKILESLSETCEEAVILGGGVPYRTSSPDLD